jgi:hypothetical protein
MRKTLLKLAVPAVVFLLATWLWVVDFSALSLAAAKAVLGVFVLYVVIKYGHDEIPAIWMYREHPQTYAAMLLAYALVIAAAIFGS